jgi:Spy/CpxP family protein refolding chaperone
VKKLAVTVFVILLAILVGTSIVSAQDNMGGAMAPQGAMGKSEVTAKLQQMSKALQLSPEQEEKIKPILMEEAPKLQAIKSDTSLTPAQKMMQMRQVREATDTQLQPILTPEQQQKLQEMRAQQKEQMMQKKELQ